MNVVSASIKTQYSPPVAVVVAAPAPVHPLPNHVGDQMAPPGKLTGQLSVSIIAQNPGCP